MAMINLRMIRNAKGLKLQDVAKVLGVKFNTVCQWEIGTREPEIKNVIKLAEYFNVTTDFILDHDIDPSFSSKFHSLVKKLSLCDEEYYDKIDALLTEYAQETEKKRIEQKRKALEAAKEKKRLEREKNGITDKDSIIIDDLDLTDVDIQDIIIQDLNIDNIECEDDEQTDTNKESKDDKKDE